MSTDNSATMALSDSTYLPPSPLELLITHPRLESVSIAHDDKHGQYQLSVRFRNGEVKVFKDAYLPMAINNANLWLMI
jgi:hypothetical protein